MRYANRISVSTVTITAVATAAVLVLAGATPGGAAPGGKPALHTSVPTLPAPQLRGDLNCDANLDPRDALAVLIFDAGFWPELPYGCWSLHQYVADPPGSNQPPGPPGVFQRGDLNCDGEVDPIDALTSLRDDAGLDLDLASGCWTMDQVVQVTWNVPPRPCLRCPAF